MANDVAGRPWKLDTPSSSVVLWEGWIKTAHFEWSGYSAQGQVCILKDQNGRIVWAPTGAFDLSEVRSGKVSWIDGLILDTLDAGTVLVYVE